MSARQFPGATWWKFDFHAHTPASDDFMNGVDQQEKDRVTPRFWLRKFMEKGIDCVAITDHNSGEWIDRLRQTLQELNTAEVKPEWHRPLHLFPGVEISASGGVHILAIFDPDTGTSDIERLVGAVDYRGDRGKSNGVTSKTIPRVVEVISQYGGIAIPAHVDRPKGLFEATGGGTLKQVLDSPNIYAMELCDDSYEKPQSYIDKQLQWTEVRGSDTHNFRDSSFGAFTWVKMDEPSIEGLRLALRDGTASANRDMGDDPNRHADWVIEELTVAQAKYVGRSRPLCCRFSPFLNAIIGGRGSGKSTLLEFMRLALRREEDLPAELAQDSQKYFSVEGDNLLIGASRISLIYCKGAVRYRLNWSDETGPPSLEVKEGGVWTPTQGEIRSLFPARIYSQKQIFELAREPSALLDIIDEAPEVDFKAYEEQHRTLESRYRQIEHKIQELDHKIEQEDRLQGESNDLARQIEQIEQSGHKEVLQTYRRRRQQLNEIERLEDAWRTKAQRVDGIRDAIAPVHIDAQRFDRHEDMLSAVNETNGKWRTIVNKLENLGREANQIVADWQAEKDASPWMQRLEADMAQFEQVRTQLERQHINPDEYPRLLTQQRALQAALQQTGEYRSRRQELAAEREGTFERILKNREALSARRQAFLTRVLEDNSSVSIEVKPFGEGWDGVEKAIRRLLRCGDRYIRDFEQLGRSYSLHDDRKIGNLKERIERIRSEDETPRDGRFRTHLQSLPQESMIELRLWFPADDVQITFGPKNQPIEQGSPGQKTAALLAFILSYGDEPLLLDQPEDDLDNELIYDLIVQQLRETKSRRQIIVVTHNANIVVNGDAEMVLPLKAANGETHVQNPASIQNGQVRQAICDILEGGRQAFEQRYRRIHPES